MPRIPVLIATAVLVLAPAPASAGWSPTPTPIRLTSSAIPVIACVSDGAAGAYVAWQEESSPGSGILRTQHVLPTGDLDPAWPADGIVACSDVGPRSEIGLVADPAGGCYAWWLAGSGTSTATLRVRRIGSDGTPDVRWPASGKSLGTTLASWRPSVIPDGSGGLYASWSSSSFAETGNNALVARLGPTGAAPAGWSPLVRAMGSLPDVNLSPAIARAADGGVFCVWARWSSDSTALPHAFCAKRLMPSGALASGWPLDGLVLADFHPWALRNLFKDQMVAAASDASGGFYALLLDPVADDPSHDWMTTTVLRRQTDGTASPAWPAAGPPLADTPQPMLDGAPPRLVSDGAGNVVAALPAAFTDSPPASILRGYDPAGAAMLDGNGGWGSAFDVVGDPISGVHFASGLACWGPGPFGTSFRSAVSFRTYTPIETNDPSGAFYEGPDLPGCVFGDVSIAPVGDGGSITFFCRLSGATGLYAVKLNRAGLVTGVGGGAPHTLAIGRARFVEGAGARVAFTLPGGGGGRLALFDLGGRRVSELRAVATDAAEVTMEGTANLEPGVYFVRLSQGPRFAIAKLLVAR